MQEILKFLPTDEEMNKLYKSHEKDFSIADSFIFEIGKVEDVRLRLNFLIQMKSIDTEGLIKDLSGCLKNYSRLVHKIESSSNLHRLLHIILVLGNILNGTEESSFCPSSLHSLNNKKEFLNHCYEFVKSNEPEVLDLGIEFDDKVFENYRNPDEVMESISESIKALESFVRNEILFSDNEFQAFVMGVKEINNGYLNELQSLERKFKALFMETCSFLGECNKDSLHFDICIGLYKHASLFHSMVSKSLLFYVLLYISITLALPNPLLPTIRQVRPANSMSSQNRDDSPNPSFQNAANNNFMSYTDFIQQQHGKDAHLSQPGYDPHYASEHKRKYKKALKKAARYGTYVLGAAGALYVGSEIFAGDRSTNITPSPA
ncbi:hypothetical protein O9G_004543 [Rozella allomycis CSF55]|uniref:FH2 domain-containing protein n=1 Tax=Rozella allomycis (strain CSF55) TaxID=988480 RepID=A0A075AS22_ROZAC|nr:hypothetical protein O9G_004543 [Rozella allomycis CSF55]|eukprot:EPZ31511.1 hypothetical protein O9G_004543 [Rozella allomycis CSF55]